MHATWIIAKKELQSYFDSLIAYILLVLFLGFSGFFTWLFGSDIFMVGQASLQSFFGIAYWTLFFFTPALTMRLLAEEKKSGTIEMLLTKAVTDRQVVVGKFLAALLLVMVALVFTFPYVITLSVIGDIDAGEILCGYAGLTLMSAAYISIGLYASSLTNNQIVAFLLALSIGLFFHIIFEVLASNFTGITAQVLSTLSLSNHFESISRGVVDTRDVIYFGSIIFVGLFLSEMSLTKRNLN
ncbi:MAG: ABC transporter permease subunit [Cyclobacteriaceae bacterium]|nr:ABC transporter permease subunit [Cyclobacteriaceae bacterium]